MPQTVPTSLIHESRVLAEKLRSIPEVSRRLMHTEKLWQYRPYQGSDPANMIDWKQSARTVTPVIREHEPITTKETYFWTDLKTTNDPLQIKAHHILYALGFLLTYKERSIGWIGARLLKTHYTEDLSNIYSHSLIENSTSLPLHNIQNSFITLAADFSAPYEDMAQAMRTYIAQGNKLLLINVSDQPAKYPIKSDCTAITTETKTEPFLIELLEKVISDTK